VRPIALRSLLLGALVLLLALVITRGRLLTVARLSDQGFFTKYPYFAAQLRAEDLPPDRLTGLSPAYLAVVAASQSLGQSMQDLRGLQIGATTVAAAACAAAAGLAGGPVAATAAAVLLLGNRSVLVNATELEPETLILFFNAAAVFFIAWWQRSRRLAALVGSALSLGLSTITRPTVLVAALLVGSWFWWVAGRRDRLRTAAWFGAAALAPILIVLAINLAVTGNAVVMDAGFAFFEGMNPLATGYAGVQPRIVNDLERITTIPDSLHVTYLLVASRAIGRPIDKDAANRYWTAKAFGFASAFPARAARLLGRKIVLASKSYEAYDLATMVRKDWELRRQGWIAFGILLSLAIAGGVMQRDTAAPFVLFACGAAAPLVIFYVTARQRNGLLPPLVMLAGLGCAGIVRALRAGQRPRALAAVATVAAASLLLHQDGWLQREDRHAWISSFGSQRLLAQARRSEPRRAAELRAHAATWLTTSTVPAPLAQVAGAAVAAVETAGTPQRLFDLAVVLVRVGEWRLADEILERLEAAEYRPARDTRAPSSPAYHRAVAHLGLGNRGSAAGFLTRARAEAPGDPDVLALSVLLSDAATAARSMGLLHALHDPFTRDLALARAHLQLGEIPRARLLLSRMERQLPEWPAPREMGVLGQR
jgi:hypothetical protein